VTAMANLGEAGSRTRVDRDIRSDSHCERIFPSRVLSGDLHPGRCMTEPHAGQAPNGRERT